MATIENNLENSFSELSQEEALEMLRQIRLSRRTPKKKVRKAIAKKSTKAKKETLTPEQAKELLKILGG